MNVSQTTSMFFFCFLSLQYLFHFYAKIIENNAATRNTSKAHIRLEIEIDVGLKFDQSKQNSLNLKLIFFLLIGEVSI